MNRFKRDFGVLNDRGEYYIPSSDQSLYASIVQAGEVVGSLVAAPLGDYVGRRGGFFGACTLVTLGVVLQLVTIGSKALLTLGRGVLGAGVGVISNCTPLYLSEIAPTAIRGAIVSSWQLMLAIGQVIGACIAQGTKDIDSTWSYRIPIIFNLFFVAILVGAQFIIPESPRWLIQKNRDEKALAALKRVNKGQDDDIRDKVIALEYNSFRQARQDELELSGEGGWGTLFRGVELRKFVCVLGILIGQQIGGVQFIFSYTVTFMTAVGLKDAFIITIIVDVIEVVGVLCSFLIVNRFGRRPLILWTSVPMFIALFVVAGIGTKGLPPQGESLPYPGVITVTQGRTIAAMICIYVFFFNLAWGPSCLGSGERACSWQEPQQDHVGRHGMLLGDRLGRHFHPAVPLLQGRSWRSDWMDLRCWHSHCHDLRLLLHPRDVRSLARGDQRDARGRCAHAQVDDVHDAVGEAHDRPEQADGR